MVELGILAMSLILVSGQPCKTGFLCETHLFDQDVDLYGARLLVRLKSFFMARKKFSGIEELIHQIGLDAKTAAAFASILFC